MGGEHSAPTVYHSWIGGFVNNNSSLMYQYLCTMNFIDSHPSLSSYNIVSLPHSLSLTFFLPLSVSLCTPPILNTASKAHFCGPLTTLVQYLQSVWLLSALKDHTVTLSLIAILSHSHPQKKQKFLGGIIMCAHE